LYNRVKSSRRGLKVGREIKFRGKRKDTGHWVSGSFYEKAQPLQCIKSEQEDKKEYFIIFPGVSDWNMPRPMYQVEIIPETLGEFTGIKDKHKKEICEGDIVQRISMAPGGIDFIGKVVFDEGSFFIENGKDAILLFDEVDELKVIGTIYENPELLEGEINE
jgi:uncharacterized phage protein (TIGR01671 family)